LTFNRLVAIVAVALVGMGSARPAQGSDGVRLQVHAGMGGFVRPFRWTPVRITLENSGPDLSGEVLIEWGDARLHRDVTIASPARLDFEVYVRAGEIRDTVTVQLLSKGAAVASFETPVRTIGDDDTLRVCVGTSPGTASGECTVTVPPSALPRSARGYDAANEVILLGGTNSELTAEQRVAIDGWRAYHALETTDLLARAPRAVPEPQLQRPARSVVIAASIYLMLLLTASIAWVRRLRRPAYAYGGIVLALIIATFGTAWAGAAGPGAIVVLRYAATLLQAGGESRVMLRGTIEYPDFGRYESRATVADGVLTTPGAATGEQWLDDAGLPVRRGTFGRGAREEVEFEGIVADAPYRVAVDRDVIRVTNVSDRVLSECRFPDGFSRGVVGDLQPGTAVDARAISGSDVPFFTCRSKQSPVALVDSRFPVRSNGVTLVSVVLPNPRDPGDLQ
jgi:hypothetical protein